MIVYFDTSAYVPLLVSEPASPAVRELWDMADRVCSSEILQVEACAALARAIRMGRLETPAASWFARRIDDDMRAFELMSVDEHVVALASQKSWDTGLRAYDLIHFVSALMLAGDDLVAASRDKELLSAWAEAGLTVIDVTR